VEPLRYSKHIYMFKLYVRLQRLEHYMNESISLAPAIVCVRLLFMLGETV